MKYIKNIVVKDRKGVPITIRIGDNTDRHDFGALLFVLLDSYIPLRDLILQPSEIRRLYKVLDILEGGPKETVFFAFEEADFEIAKKTALQMVLVHPVFAKLSPIVEDILNSVVSELPREEDKLKNQKSVQ